MEFKKFLKFFEILDDVIIGLYVFFEGDYVNVEDVILFLLFYCLKFVDWVKYVNYDFYR